MDEALEHVRTGAVAAGRARRRGRPPGRFRRGEAVGFVEEQLVAWGEPAATLESVLGDARPARRSCVTLITGRDAPLGAGRGRRARARGRRGRGLRRRAAELLVADRRRVACAAIRHRPAHPRMTRRRCGPSPTAFATATPLSAEDLRAGGARTAPRPGARRAARGQPRAGRARRRAARPATPSATCSSTCRATAARRARSPSWRPGRSRPWSSRCARSRSRPVRRRGMKPLVEAVVADDDRRDEGDVLQPAVARAQVPARHAARCSTASTRRATASASRPTRRPRRRPAPAGDVATYPATEGLSSTQILALVREHRAALGRRRSSRCPPRLRARERLPDRAGRAARRPLRRPRGRPPPAGLRRAAARPDRAAAPARRPPRAGPGPSRSPSRARADRPLARGRRCRSRPPTTSDRAMDTDRRRPRRTTARCSGC